MKVFSQTWCSWVQTFVEGANVGMTNMTLISKQKKRLRQGDPLFLILFNVVVDMSAVIIARTKENGQIKAVVSHLVEDDLSILQYVDDTLLFFKRP